MAHFPPPKLPIESKGSGASPQPFASLFKVSEKEVAKVPFTSVDDFCGLDNAKILPGSGNFVILLLQGYPSPEWLNALGSRFEIDPEFFCRHIRFNSNYIGGSVNAFQDRLVSSDILPSRDGWMVSLITTKIEPWGFGTKPHQVGYLRWQSTKDGRRYVPELTNLNLELEAGASVIRNASIFGQENHLVSLEYGLSIALNRFAEGWMGMVYPPRTEYLSYLD
jgi:hypothetical protein